VKVCREVIAVVPESKVYVVYWLTAKMDVESTFMRKSF
jgi:hypothetical protein